MVINLTEFIDIQGETIELLELVEWENQSQMLFSSMEKSYQSCYFYSVFHCIPSVFQSAKDDIVFVATATGIIPATSNATTAIATLSINVCQDSLYSSQKRMTKLKPSVLIALTGF